MNMDNQRYNHHHDDNETLVMMIMMMYIYFVTLANQGTISDDTRG